MFWICAVEKMTNSVFPCKSEKEIAEILIFKGIIEDLRRKQPLQAEGLCE